MFLIFAALYLGVGVYRTQRGNEPLWHAPIWPLGLIVGGK